MEQTTFQLPTNLQKYPILGYFPLGDSLYLNGTPVSWNSERGYRLDVDLSDDLNYFLLEAYDNTTCVTSIEYKIYYDPDYNTESHALIYSYMYADTVVVDLTQNGVLGIIPGSSIVSYTPDGRYVVDTTGKIYSAATHIYIDTLPFSATTVYPVFVDNGTSLYCYAGNEKIDFETRTFLSSSIPISADGRFQRRLLGLYREVGPGRLAGVRSGAVPAVSLRRSPPLLRGTDRGISRGPCQSRRIRIEQTATAQAADRSGRALS